jgi:hypothetical protein
VEQTYPSARKPLATSLAASLAALLALLPRAHAQDGEEVGAQVELELPAARQGYWLGGGLFTTVNQNLQLEEDDTPALLGGAGHLRMGEMFNDWLGFGLQLGGGGGGDDRYSVGYGGLMLTGQLNPWRDLALHAGLGAGGLSLTDAEIQDGTLRGTGGAYYMIGASYDLFPWYEKGSGGFSLAPTVQLQHLPGILTESWIVLVGVETLWWSGLERNKLDLSTEDAFRKEDD